MSVVSRTCPATAVRPLRGSSLVATIAVSMLAGCSADITRFDNSHFALYDSPATPPPAPSQRQMAGGPAPDAAAGGYAQPPARTRNVVEVASLPPVAPQAGAPSATQASARMPTAGRSPAPVAAPVSMPAPQSIAKGEQIEVQPGDTLYGLARRHQVLISDLMAVNDLNNPNLKPGQKLYIPAGMSTRTSPPRVRPERPAVAHTAPEPTAAASGETYTVKSGDSLYAIAARHRVKVTELQRVNGITDERKVMPGLVLRLPTGAHGQGVVEAAAAPQSAAARATYVATQPEPAAPSAPTQTHATSQGVRVINAQPGRQIAAAEPATMNDAGPAVAATPSSGKLRWPVKGRIVQGFGPRADGSHNDGVDIAVPAGTEVLAAENGVVAYAGSEVKTYGNLVLLRHDNGWVTAYANNDKILVQRGDRIKRGQPVAKAGTSGGAEQPQLHFEVRVGSKPVDPTTHLEKQ